MKKQILAVQRMQDYIEVYLEENVGLSDLTSVSLFSPWYSYRLFQEYTGLTPASYIRRLRLAKAAMRIKKEHIRMIDAAFDLALEVWTASPGRLPGSLVCVPAPMPPSLFPLRCSCLTVQKSEHSERIFQP